MFFGSPTWTRTRDLRINSPSLYRLSYQGSKKVRILISSLALVNTQITNSDNSCMKILKVALGLVVLLLVILMVFPLLYPLNLYTPQIERVVSAKLQQPVKVGEVSVRYLPMPALVLNDVHIGVGQVAEVKQISIQPNYPSWLFGRRVIKRMTLEDVRVAPAFFLSARDMLTSAAGDPNYRVQKLLISRVSVALPHGPVGPFNAELVIGEKGEFGKLLVTADATPATFTVEPYEDKYRFGFDAQGWSLPDAEGLRFSSLTINGIGNASEVDINDIRGVLYGGTLTGTGRLFFDGRWRLLAKGRLSNIQADALTAALSPATNVSGRMSADVALLAGGQSLDELAQKPQLQARVRVLDGSVNNFDFITAIRYNSPGGSGLRGGKTRFDELLASLDAKDGRYRFSSVALRSGLLNANGGLALGKEGNWSGNLQVSLKSAVNPLSAPLFVSGTLASPLLSLHAQSSEPKDVGDVSSESTD